MKKLEDILKHKNPNSLPALIWAAASAAGSGSTEQAGTVSFLERRVHRLEEELETKDEEAKQRLRAMEQQYHKIKVNINVICAFPNNDGSQYLAKTVTIYFEKGISLPTSVSRAI